MVFKDIFKRRTKNNLVLSMPSLNFPSQKTLLGFITIFRPHQWIKNGFVFLPIIFTNNLFNIPILIQTICVFFAFCLVSSAVYVFNDVLDRESDKEHPRKKYRPIASGRISISLALTCSISLLISGIALGSYIKFSVTIILLMYVVINIAYSTAIKHIIIIDVMTIATGFVLRVYAGTELTGIQATAWIVSTTYLLSLMLGYGKRRGELVLLGDNSSNHRSVLKQYTLEFLDKILILIGSCVILNYTLYTFSDDTIDRFGHSLIWTIPFVMYGIFRFFYLFDTEKFNDGPTIMLFKDPPLLTCVFLWGIVCIALIYF